jgi:tetratricopeptide (TPR) repeat protein
MNKSSKKEQTGILEKAWAHYRKGDFDSALSLFEEVLENGENMPALYGRACALFRCEEHEDAGKDVGKLLKHNANDVSALYLRAYIQGAGGNYDAVIRDLKKITELEPGSAEAWCDLGGTYLLMKDYQSAGNCFDQAADIEKTCAEAWFGKGMVSMEKKAYKAAVEFFSIAVRADSKLVYPLLARTEANMLLGKKAEAFKDLQKAVSIDADLAKAFGLDAAGPASNKHSVDMDEDDTIDDNDEMGDFKLDD